MDDWLNYVSLRQSDWIVARRYAVPATMVERATERRLAGDWRGACAAARCEVRIDGVPPEVTPRIEEDLAHLAPDLLRWHVSGFHADTDGLLLSDRRIALAAYDGGVLLEAHTPPSSDGSQRIVLTAGPATELRATSWIDSRYLWDIREAHRLLEHAGGGVRTPFFGRDGRRRDATELAESAVDPVVATDLAHPDPVVATERCLALQDAGKVEESWLASGVKLGDRFIERARTTGTEVRQPLAGVFGAVVPALSRAARAVLGAPAGPARVSLYPFLTRWSWVTDLFTLRLDDGELLAERVPATQVEDAPELPWVLWQRLPDVDLLRLGLLAAEELHPLVRSALFPEQPDPGYRPRIGPDPAGRGPGSSTEEAGQTPSPMTWAGEGFRVRCGGTWHRMVCRDGRLTALDHSAEEIAREQTLSALGGPVPPCAAVVSRWRRQSPGRIPRALRQLGHHAILAARHARADEVVRLLDAGLDAAGLRDGDGRGLMHHLGRFDDAGEAVLARLLAAGLDVNAPDSVGRTPLTCVRADGGTAKLVDAMVRAGAHDQKSRLADTKESR